MSEKEYQNEITGEHFDAKEIMEMMRQHVASGKKIIFNNDDIMPIVGEIKVLYNTPFRVIRTHVSFAEAQQESYGGVFYHKNFYEVVVAD